MNTKWKEINDNILFTLFEKYDTDDFAVLEEKIINISLLGTSAKILKGELKDGTANAIMYLSPNVIVSKKNNLCKGASKDCINACLAEYSGRMIFKAPTIARILRTLKFLLFPDLFYIQLKSEILILRSKAIVKKKTLGIRLNGGSDIKFDESIYQIKDVEFYEYTKIMDNYLYFKTLGVDITYSFSGTEKNKLEVKEILEKHKGKVAMVFDVNPLKRINKKVLPTKWDYMGKEYTVLNGDISDNRFLDKVPADQGVLIGLALKVRTNVRRALAENSEFVMNLDPVQIKEVA